MSGAHTTVRSTEAEDRESERNRVAWNLPREVRPAPPKPIQEAEEGRVLSDTDNAAENG